MIATAFKRTVVETSRPHLLPRAIGTRTRRIAVSALGLISALLLPTRAAFGAVPPPQTNDHYVQYGVGFAAETVAAAGAMCPEGATAPCILGSGLGLGIRVGYRTRGPWYVGGAYEFSRQESANLLRLAILQQLRGEARYYYLQNQRLVPYASMAVGGALYGNEWGSDTGGILAFLGVGIEYQVSRTSVVGAALGYRPIVFRRFQDRAGQVRSDELFGFGFTHMVGLELVFEVRDPLPRW
jgi:hypothetical protein